MFNKAFNPRPPAFQDRFLIVETLLPLSGSTEVAERGFSIRNLTKTIPHTLAETLFVGGGKGGVRLEFEISYLILSSDSDWWSCGIFMYVYGGEKQQQ